MKEQSSKRKKETEFAKRVAEKNMPSTLVSRWVTDVFEPNPTKKDYADALNFVEDVLKNVQKEPSYLKLLANLALQIERSKFVAKLIPHIFKTVVQYGKKSTLEFDHQLIMEELQEAAKELRQLKEKR